MKQFCMHALWAIAFLMTASISLAAPSSDDQAWQAYTSAQRKLQVGMHYLLAERAPDLKPLLTTSQELELAQIDQRTLQFNYLNQHSPERINRNSGIEAFAAFEWTDADESELSQSSTDYRKLKEKIRKLNAVKDTHPLMTDFKNKFNELASDQDPAYLELLGRYKQQSLESEDYLTRPS